MIAMRQTNDNTNAMIGNQGYKGVLKVAAACNFFFIFNKLIMLMQYITTAPSAEMIITLSVVPVYKESKPITPPALSAQCGVRNFLFILLHTAGRKPLLDNAKICLE